ncbi:MAG: polysaccharide deacetylase family protein [Ignavibacteria bacterium]|nr:polysaccharide deacetylase family protein [Ignavibacteria bacterium]
MKLSSGGIDFTVYLPPYPYKGAVALSFDYESSAQSLKPSLSAKLKTRYRRVMNTFAGGNYDLSSGYGRGYGNREGAELVREIFREHGIHGTWFSTGHVILKGNKSGDAYRINQKLDYATKESGFEFIEWRRRYNSFYHEPYGDYKSHKYYYLGDQSESLKAGGEDIQCHSFSHPYIAMEPEGNIKIDLEDWQKTAEREGFDKAKIFAFPYLGDCYCIDKKTNIKILPSVCENNDECGNLLLDSNILEIFKQAGIELFTRCYSAINNDDSIDFGKYNNSEIGYINSRGIFSFLDDMKSFQMFLKNTAEKCSIIDLWLHPNDIMEKIHYDFFASAVKMLAAERNDGSIWIPTISELWEKKKIISKLTLSENEGSFILSNNSDEEIPNLVFKTDNPDYGIAPNENISAIGSGKYRAGLHRRQQISFKLERAA